MSSINRVILIGNLGKDPEIRHTNSGGRIANLSVATNQDGHTEWNRVVILNEQLVDVADRFLKKGTRVYIEGAVQNRKWTDQQGRERESTEVVLRQYGSTLRMLDERKQAQQ